MAFNPVYIIHNYYGKPILQNIYNNSIVSPSYLNFLDVKNEFITSHISLKIDIILFLGELFLRKISVTVGMNHQLEYSIRSSAVRKVTVLASNYSLKHCQVNTYCGVLSQFMCLIVGYNLT